MIIRDVQSVSRLLVLTLAAAVATTPIVLAGCLIACTPGAVPVAQSPTADHGCHRSDSGAAVSLRDAGKRCGHDHNQAGLTTPPPSTNGTSLKIAHPIATYVVAVPDSIDTRGALRSRRAISTPVLRSLASLALPLRV